jgi:hypothetical protein
MRRLTVIASLFVCSGCMQTDEHGQTIALLDQVPMANETLVGRYNDVANCAYSRLDKASGSGIKKVDLENETRLVLEGGGTRQWQLTFTPVGTGRTAVAFTQMQTMWGPLGSKEVMPIVRGCGT